MRADSEILADLVKALSGTSRNGAHHQRQRQELTNRGHTETTGDLMTRPEHYIAAEELPEDVGHARDQDDAARVLGIAQVHATPALTAATGWRKGISTTGQGRRSRYQGQPPRSRTRAAQLGRTIARSYLRPVALAHARARRRTARR
jgi:hypothetical protein